MAKNKIDSKLIEQVRGFFERKKSASEISRILKIDVNKITKICKENNIVNPYFIKGTIIDEDIINLVLDMVNKNLNMKTIAEKIGYSVKALRKLYRKLNLNIKGGQKPLAIPTEKLCKYNDGKGCGLVKSIAEYRILTVKEESGNIYNRPENYCHECSLRNSRENSKKHYENNVKYYHDKNQANKNKNNESRKKREEKDPVLKLRNTVSRNIGKHLKRNSGSKRGQSIMDYLPYIIEELRVHIEKQWQNPGNEWMTWENHGSYKLGGEKKWHIDHIIPQSLLPFDSMEHPNFLKCWSLENLRPLEAVENIKKRNKIIDVAE